MSSMSRYRQQGAVLIVSLLILLVVSVLGVTSVTTTSMEEKMASNTRQERVAFEAAEVALRTAEDWLFANITDQSQILGSFDGTGGLYSGVVTLLSADAPLDFDVDDSSVWLSGSEGVAVTSIPMFPSGTNRPRYVIEYVGRVGDPPLDFNEPDMRQFAFRIIAIGWGLDTSAHYLLESTVRMPL